MYEGVRMIWRKKSKFRSTKIVRKPVIVRFRTKTGRQVTFRATKILRKPNIKRKPTKLSFYRKRRTR